MKLDPKGIEAAQAEFFYWRVDPSSNHAMTRALEAYLKATDTVLVPREATEKTIQAIKDWPHSYVHGPRSFYAAMIQAAEGEHDPKCV